MGKVLLLSGSPRKKGNTMQVLAECAKVLEDNGIETETVSLAGKKIQSCLGCRKCGEKGECVQDDGLNEIIAKLRQCHGFVVGSPVYFGTARGDTMSAVQRIAMVNRQTDGFLSRMVGGPIAVARRGAHTATIQEMLMFCFISDMIVPGSNYWNMVFGKEAGEAMEDEEGLKTVRRFSENVAWLINNLYH